MIAIKRSIWLTLVLALAACVTVNIYFPAAAAEKAADQIIEDIWQSDTSNAKPDSVSDEQTSADAQSPEMRVRQAIVALISSSSRVAHAQNVDFNVSSTKISAIKAKMAERFKKIRPYYDSGAVGFAANGYVALRDANAVPMPDRAKVNKLVSAENADRKALYAAIAEANKQPSWAEQIRQSFAKRWAEQAKSGWWIQSGGSWKQK